MARGVISRAQVNAAMELLRSRGIYPSLDRIIGEVGGNKGTIKAHRDSIELERASSIADSALMNELTIMNLGILERLKLEATKALKDAIALHKEQSGALQKEITEYQDALLQCQSNLSTQAALNVVLSSDIATLNTQNIQLTDEIRIKHEQVLMLQGENGALEERRRRAKDALDHYREAIAAQREQEQRNHEQRVAQLQAEVRVLQQTLSVKQEEIVQLNRDNGAVHTSMTAMRREMTLAKDELIESNKALEAANNRIHTIERESAEQAAALKTQAMEVVSLREEHNKLQRTIQRMLLKMAQRKRQESTQ